LKEAWVKERGGGGLRVRGWCKNSIRWTETLAVASAWHATRALCLLMARDVLKGYDCRLRLTYIQLYALLLHSGKQFGANLSSFYLFSCHINVTWKGK
jgi:hypothetical protein